MSEQLDDDLQGVNCSMTESPNNTSSYETRYYSMRSNYFFGGCHTGVKRFRLRADCT
jgi:hypothetical protein